MNIRELIKDMLPKRDENEAVLEKLSSLSNESAKIREQISELQNTLADNTRALSTLAIIQARLINEISEIMDQRQREKKAAVKKNPGPEFTN